MDEEKIRQARFARVKAAHEAGLNALTILRARRYLDGCPGEESLDYFVWFWLGETLAESGRYDEAEEALTRALRLCPAGRERIPLCEMGHLEGSRGEYERAAGWFRKAIDADPRHAAGYIYPGGILSLQGRLREAEEVHRTATETCYEGCLERSLPEPGPGPSRAGAVRRSGRMLPRGHPHGPGLPRRRAGPSATSSVASGC